MVLKACDRPENQTVANAANAAKAANSNANSAPAKSDAGNHTVTDGGPQPTDQSQPPTPSDNNNEPQTKKKKKKKDRDKDGILENGDAELYAIPPEAKKAKIAEKMVYEDLANDASSSFTKLNLTRIDRYLNGPIPDFKTDPVSSDQIKQTALVMREYNKKWSNCPRLLDSVTAVKVLGELRPGGILMKGNRNENTSREYNAFYKISHFMTCIP